MRNIQIEIFCASLRTDMTVTGINIIDSACVLKNKHKEQYLKRKQERDLPLLNDVGD